VPDLPTMSEAGVPGFQASSWFAVFAPAKTPRPVINKLNTEIVKVIHAPELRDRMTALGFEVVGGTPEELGAFLKAEIAKWSKVIRDSGAKVD
jgi:tripartite-type tricarboxylate transporter receptor subunit TctC